jgi:hypothetical protein
MKNYSRILLVLLALIVLATALVAPLAAQTTQNPDDLIFISGTIDLTQGGITIAGYTLVAGATPLPPVLRQGDYVIIIGYLQATGVTVVIESIDLIEDPNATPTPTPEVTPEVTPEATPELTDCARDDHPVATRYADAFDVSYDEIIAWHCQGFGFGEIARAYLLAEANGEDVTTYFDARLGGQGWGQIMRDSDVHPSDLAPGRVGRGDNDDGEDGEESGEQRGNGSGGNGNGNSGGNGNGNGNGGGNGNGNGDKNGNGNGNGRGNGNGNGG